MVALLTHYGILNAFPLHDNVALEAMAQGLWSFSDSPATDSSLNRLQKYFGSEIAIYYAWMGFYVTWLLAPAILGLAIHLRDDGKDADLVRLHLPLGAPPVL